MAKKGRPRYGSMGVWPRKRAARPYARIRSFPEIKEAKPLFFPAYKAGMTRIGVLGMDKNKTNFGIEESQAVTILECPPIKIASMRLYKKSNNKKIVSTQINFKTDKELSRKISKINEEKISSSKDLESIKIEDYSDLTVQAYTMPKQAELKKTPELFELELGGSIQEKLEFVKNKIDKTITVNEVLKEGQLIDAHGVTRGKGFQGPVKRFGIGLKNHKSEKGQRAPGSVGSWIGQAHVAHRVARAGQTGYHVRTQHNNLIMKISDKPDEINPKGGFINYGLVKAPYIMIKGSLQGHKKRLLFLAEPIRKPSRKINFTTDMIKYVSKESHQGR
ncbi:50S ribosomal protein L3 [Candidatus Woesearchaeota archaeon]|jgi:large subunit ribosomal protein L3|nr:50S ribosomal protein L3 [Candidatus Woesearchaeota archaeon]